MVSQPSTWTWCVRFVDALDPNTSRAFWVALGPPGATAWSSGSLGWCGGLSGESSSTLSLKRSRTRTNVSRSLFGFSLVSSAHLDTADTSASYPGSPGSTRAHPGENVRSLRFELSLTRFDVLRSFAGHFQSSSSSYGAPEVSVSGPVSDAFLMLLIVKLAAVCTYSWSPDTRLQGNLRFRPDANHVAIFQVSLKLGASQSPLHNSPCRLCEHTVMASVPHALPSRWL